MVSDVVTGAEYDAAVADLRGQLAALPAGAPVRLGKKTSNLFRTRTGDAQRLDVSAFSGVLSVADGVAEVLGMTTYEDLVDATLPSGQMPLVVPQLKTITLGGAVTGLGIESSSFRNGTPHESVLEMDVLTGDGRIVTCSRTENADLFYGFPNSYGTLGYALRLRIELEPTHPYVHLRHVRCGSVAAAVELMRQPEADFVDGTWFSPTEVYVTLGSWADTAPSLSDYTGMAIYYRSVQTKAEDWLTVRDYLWRWDTDWFWCSRAFGVQNPAVRRWVPRRYLRSDVWWKLVAFERRHRWKTRSTGAAGCRSARRWSRTSRSRSTGSWSSWRCSPARSRSSRCGSARCSSGPPTTSGSSTGWTRRSATSTSASGRRCRSNRGSRTAPTTA
jgi:FAD/FMN-containing dehydrogenase